MRNSNSTPFAFALILTVALTAAFAFGCSDDELGASCDRDNDCSEGRCIEGKDFPDGICTDRCDDDRDCADGWSCISKSGGVCLERCDSNSECRDLYDDHWACRNLDRKGEKGKDEVCIGE